ncbi:unnamed protein product [Meganyctiphanes norvegica]|uniref:Uncharacterized protein n=1 Tax=Meganyctiphanes norvegica TaxID=48144 RepID=A0AAV2SDY7_MEGNR
MGEADLRPLYRIINSCLAESLTMVRLSSFSSLKRLRHSFSFFGVVKALIRIFWSSFFVLSWSMIVRLPRANVISLTFMNAPLVCFCSLSIVSCSSLISTLTVS